MRPDLKRGSQGSERWSKSPKITPWSLNPGLFDYRTLGAPSGLTPFHLTTLKTQQPGNTTVTPGSTSKGSGAAGRAVTCISTLVGT